MKSKWKFFSLFLLTVIVGLGALVLVLTPKSVLNYFVPEINSVKKISIFFRGDTAFVNLSLGISNRGFFKMDINDRIVYKVQLNNKYFATGNKKLNIHLKGYESDTLSLPVKILFDDLRTEIRRLQGTDSVSYNADVDIYYSLPFYGEIKIPLKENGMVLVPVPPEFDVMKVKLKKVRFPNVDIEVTLKVTNLNNTTLHMKDFKYHLAIGSIINSQGKHEENIIIKPKGVTIIKIPVTSVLKKVGKTLIHLIKDQDEYPYVLKMEGEVDFEKIPEINNTAVQFIKKGKMELID